MFCKLKLLRRPSGGVFAFYVTKQAFCVTSLVIYLAAFYNGNENSRSRLVRFYEELK